jgi:hypothetical protein
VNRMIVQATFTPITDCKSACSFEECKSAPTYTIAIWPEAEHGPFEEPSGFHSCTEHFQGVCLFVSQAIHDTLEAEHNRFYGIETDTSEGGEADA